MKWGPGDSALGGDMTEEQKDHLLADCLEAYHQQRARGEIPDLAAFGARLGDLFPEFQELVAAESAIDTALAPPEVEQLPRAWGEYTLLSELGRGATGVVYEAVHRKLGRKVAVKVLRTGMDTDTTARERFRREARALAQMRHDHIVEIYEFGEVADRPYFAMALVEGPTLADMCRSGRSPDPQTLCAGMADIADALDALHRVGIVHRDVKPSNIMVDPRGRYLLADFGLARTAMSVTMTRTGDALGTPLFMSPEQMLGKRDEIAAHTDVYGLGATLYQMLVGQPPFKTDDLHALMRMILTDRPTPPHTLKPDLPRGCGTIAVKCLEKDPRDRYESAAALAGDLRAFAEGRPVSGRPVSRLARGSRAVRRHPVLAAAALLVAGAVLWEVLRPPEPAHLTLDVWPAATVLVDAQELEAPLVRHPLTPNRKHTIVLRSKTEGFLEWAEGIETSPDQVIKFDIMLEPKDPSDPKLIAQLARRSQIDFPSEGMEAPEFQRGSGGGADLSVLFPRGKVRLEDVKQWRVDITDSFNGEGKLIFLRKGESLGEMAFPEPQTFQTSGEIPAAVLDALRPGDKVTWGYQSADGKRIQQTTFEVVAPDIAGRLAAIEQGVDHYDSAKTRAIVAATLRSRLLLNHGLALAAWREIQAEVAAGRETLLLLTLQLNALKTLFPDDAERTTVPPWQVFQAAWSTHHSTPEERKAFLERFTDR